MLNSVGRAINVHSVICVVLTKLVCREMLCPERLAIGQLHLILQLQTFPLRDRDRDGEGEGESGELDGATVSAQRAHFTEKSSKPLEFVLLYCK